MAKRNEKPVKKINQASLLLNRTTILIGLITLVTLSFLAIVTKSLGVVGDFFADQLLKVFGIGAYILPVILLADLIIVLIRKMNLRLRICFVYVYALFLAFLLIVDINTLTGSTLELRIKNSLDLAKILRGSGILGATLGYTFIKYIGTLGSYIVAASVLFFAILYFVNMKVTDFIREFFLMVKQIFLWTGNKLDEYKEKRRHISVGEEFPIKNDKVSSSASNTAEKDDSEISSSIDIRSHLDHINNSKREEDPKQMTWSDYGDILEDDFAEYLPPPLHLLNSSITTRDDEYINDINEKGKKIEDLLKSFKVNARVVTATRGPSVTCYELEPASGVKIASISSLSDDLALALASPDIRILAPIPGKSVIGIEVPNKDKDDVYLKDIINSDEYRKMNSKMPLSLGKNLTGKPVVSKIEAMPHLLIAGATGSGKSVCINTIILSILYRSGPEDVKFILIDPKVVELNVYNDIPHLVIPVVTDAKKASYALNWAVREMERRYSVFANKKVKDITSYKKLSESEELERMPYIVVIIDELADLMMVAAQEVEDHICRLAQMARACGIYLIVATQRPSVDVITGTIKANIPSRISFAVSSQIDSRTILDSSGAEKLLGRGDMLFSLSSFRQPERLQGAFVSEAEVSRVVEYVKELSTVEYDSKAIEEIDKQHNNKVKLDDYDELLIEAVDIVIREDQASVSLLQRKMKIGYARAGRLIDTMESLAIVGPSEGNKPRKIMVSRNILKEDENNEYSEQTDCV